MSCKRYELLHNLPEIKRGAIVEADCSDERYVVTNLSEVARYSNAKKFTFAKECVENMPYWFDRLDY